MSKTQTLVPSTCWFHVDGKENISDCLSRGMSPSQFIENKLWLSGPKWLTYDISCWPIKPIGMEHCTKLEEKPVALLISTSEIHPFYFLADRCSSWIKLLHAIVYVLRFVKLLPRAEFFVADDLDKAEKVLLKVVQNLHFSSELKTLEKDGSCSSHLKRLRPFIHDRILRVGGRLDNSQLNFDVQHPILLRKRDPVVDLLIDHYHQSNLHTGPNLVLSLLRQRYWILSARGVVRYRIQKCNICFKLKTKAQFPLTGNLPSCRVQESKAFLDNGVDYCSSIQTIPYRRRGVRSQKNLYLSFYLFSDKGSTFRARVRFIHC